jgi:hypothetical protein
MIDVDVENASFLRYLNLGLTLAQPGRVPAAVPFPFKMLVDELHLAWRAARPSWLSFYCTLPLSTCSIHSSSTVIPYTSHVATKDEKFRVLTFAMDLRDGSDG